MKNFDISIWNTLYKRTFHNFQTNNFNCGWGKKKNPSARVSRRGISRWYDEIDGSRYREWIKNGSRVIFNRRRNKSKARLSRSANKRGVCLFRFLFDATHILVVCEFVHIPSPLNIYPSFRGLLAPFTRPKLEHVSEKSSLWLFSFSRRSVPSILTDNHQINVIRVRVMEIKYFSRLETILPSFATDPFGSRRIFRIHKDSINRNKTFLNSRSI